jgi:hypothetical protein
LIDLSGCTLSEARTTLGFSGSRSSAFTVPTLMPLKTTWLPTARPVTGSLKITVSGAFVVVSLPRASQ